MIKFKKTIIITASLFLLIIISVQLFKDKTLPPKPETPIIPSTTPRTTYPLENELRVVGVPNLLDQLSVIDPISIVFNEKIDHASLEYFIEPDVKATTELGKEGFQLVFKPLDYWRPNLQYTLVITALKGVNNNVFLRESFEIKFKALVNYDDPEEAPAERSNPL